ncbi:transposase [Streptomyces sp. NBC_00878]|uniref:transposase n=2 Tax=unclassified Streptomyces TaxID=2593676 RepID=UPI00225AF7DA|nr:transposase [Streptomyces sp. NBC_00878]MCX4906291.1 transposase [Streptomyces sp. NBC_00878]
MMPAPRKYPLELRERAVRMYRTAEPKPVIRRMAEELGVHHEALRNWIRQAEADAGERDDLLTTEEKNELAQLRREVRDLRRANEVLRTASAFFAAQPESDRPLTFLMPGLPSPRSVPVTSAQHRRRSPSRGPLGLEIRTILATTGPPEADSDDRYRTHGVVVTDSGESAGVEWFTSRSLRRAAADEQLRGRPMAAADSGRSPPSSAGPTQEHSARARCADPYQPHVCVVLASTH